ncbi:MAG: diaminopimelate epimerase [Methanomicrobiales archaeon]|nr:diaminopimelate epimerase [Methanomicrobiales archaeon]
MEIVFVKLQGNGNDFILINEYLEQVIPEDLKADFATAYCDRRFGIGGDGVLFLSKSDVADLRMRLFQPDRSEASMCGNGIRCLVRFAFDAGYVQNDCLVETGAGIIPVTMGYGEDGFMASVQMPNPAFEPSKIPASVPGREYREEIEGFTVYAVNTGVPHAVIPVEDVARVDLGRIGPIVRHHQTFPEGANVNLVQHLGESKIRIRTYERGVEAETLSCGTGATAAAAVAHRLGIVGPSVEVETPGGPLWIELGSVTRMKGPADTVFYGVLPIL